MARTSRSRTGSTTVEEHTRLEDFWDEPATGSQTIRPDAEALQGAWMAVSGRRKAEFLISGNHVTVHFADGDIYMGSFSLGKSAWPRTMDVRIEEGPPRHKGLVALCIYQLDGDTLRWCTATPGQSDRPTTFDEGDPRFLCLTFHREHTER